MNRVKLIAGVMIMALAYTQPSSADRYGYPAYGTGSYTDMAEVLEVEPITRLVRVETPRRECWDEEVPVRHSAPYYGSATPTIISLHRRTAEYANTPQPTTSSNVITMGFMVDPCPYRVTQASARARTQGLALDMATNDAERSLCARPFARKKPAPRNRKSRTAVVIPSAGAVPA